jgi:hypothetical protein
VGYYFPQGGSDLWEEEFLNMDFTKTDFTHSSFSFAYEYFLSRQLSLMLGIEGYSKQKSGFYRDYVGYQDVDGDWAYPNDFEGDFIPGHVFSVSSTPIQLSLKLTPMGRKGKVIPYIGGGVGLYIWSVRLQGDLVDFEDVWVDQDFNIDVYPIVFVDARDENKFAIGFHGFGGIMVPVASRISLEAEVKYNRATGNLENFLDFEPFDLGGLQISFGINYWF